MIKVSINNICAKLTECEPLTSGMIGKTLDVELSADWNNYEKTAVFSNGDITIDVLESQWSGNTITIPHEVLAVPNRTIVFGMYGFGVENGTVHALPTIYAKIGIPMVGADPTSDPTTDPSLPVYAQLQWKIDHFEISDEQIAEQVQAYLDEHPIEIQPATASVLGGVKVGEGLSVTADGTLSASGGGIPEAPIDGKQYARQDGAWTEVQSASGDAKAIGRACYNLLAKAVYTEDVTALMSALWALVGANLVSISAVFTQGATVIYPSTALDSLKTMLVVTAHYDDSTTAEIDDYTLSGTLAEGVSTITATYNGKTATFNVNVTAEPVIPVLDYISAVYTQSGEVYETAALDDLKADLVVTAHLTDESTYVVASNDYTLSGTLAVGTSVVTVSYEDKTTTFNVTVSEIPVVAYTITNNLTNCSNSNNAVSINDGESYSATITADEGYTLDSVVCTMGGIAQTVVDGVISIASVTGNIVITASAVVPTPTTQYALHQVAGYGGQFDTGKSTQTDHVAKVEVTLEIPQPGTTNTKVIFSGFLGWFGFSNNEWKAEQPVEGFAVDRPFSDVVGNGKQTITITGLDSHWATIRTGYSTPSFNPEVTWYEIKLLDASDNVIADWKPTANVGEMYDSVSGATSNFPTTTGLTVSEVTV